MKRQRGRKGKLTGVPRSRPEMAGAEFRAIRQDELGWTQEKLAVAMGVGTLNLLNWENDKTRIMPHHIRHVRLIVKMRQSMGAEKFDKMMFGEEKEDSVAV